MLFEHDENEFLKTLPDCSLDLRRDWTGGSEPEKLFSTLKGEIRWVRKKLWMYGRWVDLPEKDMAEYAKAKRATPRVLRQIVRDQLTFSEEIRKIAETGIQDRLAKMVPERTAAWPAGIREETMLLLATRKFKSEFRRAMREVAEEWLEDSAAGNTCPFTDGQIEALTAWRRKPRKAV